MRKPKAGDDATAARRQRAEARLRAQQGNGVDAKVRTEADRLSHELRVHELELEMQNEELRATRQELEAGLARYTELFDFAPIGYASLDFDATIREINHAGARLLGDERGALVGHHLERQIAAPDRPVFRALLERAIVTEGKEVCEVDLGAGARGRIGLRISATVIHGPRPVILVAFEDVTERKRASDVLFFLGETSHRLALSLDPAAIAGAAARLAASFIADLVAVDVIGDDGRWQRAAFEHREHAYTARFAQIAPGFTLLPCMAAAATRAEELGEPQAIADLRLELNDPDIATARRELVRGLGLGSCLLVPLVSRGRTVGMLTLVSRASDREASPGDLALATEFARRVANMLENSLLHTQVVQASRTKDQFLAMVSHELRTPLAAILMWVRALRSAASAPARERALDAIENAVRLQSRLVEDLVDLVRSLGGKLSMALSAIDVEQTVLQAIDTQRPVAACRSVVIDADDVRSCGLVWADAHRLVQIVTNLLSNAIKFSVDGGRVVVGLDASGDDVVLTVRDDGLGISPDLLPVLFEPFRQGADGLDPPGGGLGLGLAVVKRLVEMHGGSVAATSRGHGCGAEFTVRLPKLGEHAGSEERRARS
jgi:PAS domain S-box-containing protein